ncbi:MAG: efflux RND transporter periplasmic adaptor subunit [Planctomycetes bacterium]|nr:efflux RND transporter periplasmic adaptor subunit [Planctomycetota bacterium]MCB9890459.1 efflux RND transporter periplasmic adaptor subunit [Planctomycetota bacterium]MCB9917700.1 efflux RND transporter periplasmic adaptor subunit [Planctomycetota bacterium]
MKASTIGLSLIVVLGGGWFVWSKFLKNPAAEASSASLMTVEPGTLRVEVTTSATVYASKSEVVRCNVEGRTTILWLAEEGKTVKKGEKVADLDVSSIRDRSETQAISVSRARAALITAEKNLEIQKNQNASDIEAARNEVLFAQLELEKFLGREEMRRRGDVPSEVLSESDNGGAAATNAPSPTEASSQTGEAGNTTMGVRLQELVAARADIEIAQEEVKRAQNRLRWTKELWESKYVTDQDLEADELALKKADKQLTLAQNKLHILDRYTLLKTERELVAKVKEAQAEERRTELRCEARIAQEEADLNSKKQEFELEQAKFDKFKEQIAYGTLYAPGDGLIVYATVGDRRRQEPIDLGTEVREGQEIIKLPDVTTMRLRASVPESVVSKVEEGQRVEIKVQTVQDKIFYGEITRVAKVHDSSNSWFSDTKEYRTDISIFGSHPELREGVSATALIKVADLENVLTVPVHAIQRAGQVLYVWVQTDSGPVERIIEKGMSNERRVEIKSGLTAGDKVWLSTPPGVKRPLFEKENAEIQAKEQERKERAIESAAQRRSSSGGPSSGGPSSGGSEVGDSTNRSPIGTGPGGNESGAGGRPGGSGGANDEERQARRQRMTAFVEEVKARFPEDAGKLESMMSLFRDAELRAKIDADPVLGPKLREMMQGMGGRTRRGGQGAGGQGDGPGASGDGQDAGGDGSGRTRRGGNGGFGGGNRGTGRDG